MSVNRAVTNMLTLANELARMAGPKCRETVSAALRRWEEKIRERVRLEMALKLADDSGGGRQVQRVAVSLCDGLPVALLAYEHDLTTELAEIAGMFRPDLLSFSESAAALQQLMDRLGSVGDSRAEDFARDSRGLGQPCYRLCVGDECRHGPGSRPGSE
jgi:hypothetical protein